MSDEELLEKLQGDRNQVNQAAKHMVDHPHWRRSVTILLQRFNMDQSDFDAVLFESITSLCTLVKNGKYKRESSLKTFFQGVCKNVIRNKIAFQKRYAKRIALMEGTQLTSLETNNLTEDISVERAKDLKELFKQIVEKLGEPCKQGLIMKVQGFKDLEIAARLNFSHGSIRKRLSKCREKLRELGTQDTTFMDELESLL